MGTLELAAAIVQLATVLAQNYQLDMKSLPEADRADRAKHEWEVQKFWLDLFAKLTKGIQ